MRIIELRIDQEDELLGFEATALVNQPAIEANFFAFNDVDMDEFLFEKILEEVLTEEEKKTKKFKKVVDVDGQLAFDNIEDALIYAGGLGCQGYHEHEVDGEVMYMACETHDDPAYTQLEKDSVSQEFSHFEDLPNSTQERLLERMSKVGRTLKSYEDEGYVVVEEEEFTKKFGFGSLPTRNSAKPDLPTIDTVGSFKVLYKYKVEPGMGSPIQENSRDFCRRLIDMNLLFRLEDINKMTLNGANSSEFGYYDIFTYKGSYNCRHKWSKVYVVQRDSDLPAAVAQLLQPVENQNMSKMSFAVEGDQMMVTGPLMIPNKLIFRVDENNEPYFVYFTESTIKMIAKKMMERKLLDKMNLEHDPDQPVDGQLVETWFVEDPEKDKQQIYGFNFVKGTWMGTYKINDKSAWQMVKDGTIKGFSIEGFFTNREVQ